MVLISKTLLLSLKQGVKQNRSLCGITWLTLIAGCKLILIWDFFGMYIVTLREIENQSLLVDILHDPILQATQMLNFSWKNSELH